MSVFKNRFKTACPKEPVPPVINNVLFAKTDIKIPLSVRVVCSFSLGYEAIMNTEILYEVDKVVRANRHEIQGTIVSTGDCH